MDIHKSNLNVGIIDFFIYIRNLYLILVPLKHYSYITKKFQFKIKREFKLFTFHEINSIFK